MIFACIAGSMLIALASLFYLSLSARQPAPDVTYMNLKGEKISLDDIKIPHFVVACEKDHIAPWKASFKGLSRLQGAGRFVLAQSGHIAGIVNHPDKKKYGYWVSDAPPTDQEAWRAGTTAHDGSWWPDWAAWLKRRSGKQIDAAVSFSPDLPKLESAPGRYVRE